MRRRMKTERENGVCKGLRSGVDLVRKERVGCSGVVRGRERMVNVRGVVGQLYLSAKREDKNEKRYSLGNREESADNS